MASTPDPPPFTDPGPPNQGGGDYQVDARLRDGWAGPVMAGRYRRTGRRVTVQGVRAELAAAPAFTERLAGTGRAAARVRDPNLLAVYDLVDTGTTLRLIAEWCDGQALATIPRSALTSARAAHVIDGILAGLSTLHAGGLVHGHVAAQTVVVEPDGTARLAELAVCAAADPTAGPEDDVRAAARLGLELLGNGRRQERMRQVLRGILQATGPVTAAAARSAFAAAATAALGDGWAAGKRGQAPTRLRRRWMVAAAAVALVGAVAVAAVLLFTGSGGGGNLAPATPLTLAGDASLNVTPATGGCNTTFVFVGRGSVRGTGRLVYRWEQSDGQASADTPLAITADDGSFQLTQAWRLQGAQTVDGAMTLHILQPVELTLKRPFRYTCA